jgi:hypothetical protein
MDLWNVIQHESITKLEARRRAITPNPDQLIGILD